MVFEGHGIDPPPGGGIADIQAAGGISAGCPDIFKGTASAFGNPKAPVLVVPCFICAQIGKRISG